jgi:ADP-ribose pyrophosphatase YjhB (NUDIX family)
MDPNLTYSDNVIPSLRFQFCPMCASPLTRAVIFDDNLPRVTCPRCGWIQLSSNVVGVVTVAWDKRGIAVLVPPGEDGIGLPAGLVEYGESPEMAAIREVYEETGLEVEIVNSLGWFFSERTTWPGPMVQFMYEARILGGELRGSQEGDAKMIPETELPAVSSHRVGSRKAIDAYLSKNRNR